MERKTKKMVALEEEIKTLIEKRDGIHTTLDGLNKYKPTSDAGTQAHAEAVAQFHHDRDIVNQDIEHLKVKLDLATIEMLAGKDADFSDFAEPTPAEALANAS